MRGSFDAIVIGAGITGLAVAAELSAGRRVLALEAAATHASRASARSASSWIAGYGGPAVSPFTLASRAWYEAGGGGYRERSLLRRRGMLLAAAEPTSPGLAAALASGAVPVDADEARRLFPPLREGLVSAGAYEPDTFEIDTPVAVESFRMRLLENGGTVLVASPVMSITRSSGRWLVTARSERFATPLVVDAAGAWADQVAAMAGVPPIGLAPLRRTACTFAARADVDPDGLPLLMDADERFYIKPEPGGFLASPADETPQAPGPARARPEDVDTALRHVERVTTLDPRPVRSSWAGLRSFVPDRAPVLGPDPAAEGFAWSAGVGGYGIMTAPAVARAVVDLVDAGRLPADIQGFGARAQCVLPDRLRETAVLSPS